MSARIDYLESLGLSKDINYSISKRVFTSDDASDTNLFDTFFRLFESALLKGSDISIENQVKDSAFFDKEIVPS